MVVNICGFHLNSAVNGTQNLYSIFVISFGILSIKISSPLWRFHYERPPWIPTKWTKMHQLAAYICKIDKRITRSIKLIKRKKWTSFLNIFKEASFESPIFTRKVLMLWFSMANTNIINTDYIPSPLPRLL